MGDLVSITEHDCVESQPSEIEERFYDLKGGDEVVVYGWDGGNEYVKAELVVNYVDFTSTNNTEDSVSDMEGGSKLIYKWNPAEPSLGISEPYPEQPLIFETSSGDRFDVLGLEKK